MSEVLIIEGDNALVISDDPITLVISDDSITLVEVAIQGMPGAQGIPGPAGVSYLTYVASGALGGHRVVRTAFTGGVRYADNTSVLGAFAIVGITLGAAANGASVNVASSGEIVEPSWAWAEALPIFLSANGGLTQTPPTTGFQLVVGVATSPTSMLVGIKTPIIL